MDIFPVQISILKIKDKLIIDISRFRERTTVSDPEQMYRVLANLVRNARQAITATGAAIITPLAPINTAITANTRQDLSKNAPKAP